MTDQRRCLLRKPPVAGIAFGRKRHGGTLPWHDGSWRCKSFGVTAIAATVAVSNARTLGGITRCVVRLAFILRRFAVREQRNVGVWLRSNPTCPAVFSSYDRFFPNQDTMPLGGFGNLIALPLRKRAEAALGVSEEEERLILATGRDVGEGFDNARLDTLFLTMPISWKGTLAQYVGRLHRRYAGKSDVLVVDYLDAAVPVLARIAAKRRAGYRMPGYTIE